MRLHQCRPALFPWPALAQVLPCKFRTIFLMRRLITTPRVWLLHLVSNRPLRCHNPAPASSGAPLPSMTPQKVPKPSFTVELAFLHLLVEWRFLTQAPHMLSSDVMFSIACTRLVR